ncbi:unnamed protein product [Arabidopsis thaliana]|uniref:(thale cress) hypothetical protein n=1 Tax=Arabidopsis thaliana TaxID=3702 RepID=A0A7G2EKN4_ARATH|nr:unnamed protein product [Arabidopsis thaliana]
MDAQAKKKAMFRSKLNAKKKDTRIDSPLVRYNESDQPVCRVCNVVLKSESLWDVHQASRKHHEAIDNLKASAAGTQRGSKPVETRPTKTEVLAKSSKSQTSSGLPPNFFENREPAREVEPAKSKNLEQSKHTIGSETNKSKGPLPAGFFDNQKTDSSNTKTTSEPKQSQTQTTGPETKPMVNGNLPTGFFDNKEADLLAHGIKLVKPDIKDEYKEFEKLIQDDLQVDAAETIEEEEQREQRSYKEKVEILKRKKMELKAARLAKRSKTSEESVKKPKKTEEESPSDEEDDEDSAVDWRAQHL